MTRQALVRQRLTLGLSQAALAQRAGVSYMVVYHVETGTIPRAANIPRLAKAYEMTALEFVAELFKEVSHD